MLLVSTQDRNVGAPPQPGKASRPHILISDDQHDILTALSLLLKLNHFSTESVDSPSDAISALRERNFDLVLMDLNYSRDTTSGREGLELLTAIRHSGITTPVVVMTAWGNVELAVDAMRLGANDFIQKPWDNQRLLSTLRKVLERADSKRQREFETHSELEIARHVQQKLFPQRTPALATLECAAACIPAREVGGDYYDFFALEEGRIAGLLADISGKGVAAAMLMAHLQACFRSQLDGGIKSPTDLLQVVNRLFYASSPPEQYVTLFYFEYEERSRRLRYVNCGHLAPAILRSSSAMDRLESTATVLGLFPKWACEYHETTLSEGEVLVIFTDGVTDFLDSQGNEFGEHRFLSLAESIRQLTPAAAIRHLTERLAALGGGSEQFDDQTIVWLRGRQV